MGKGLILIGLLTIGGVIAGKGEDIYTGVGNQFNDPRFLPTVGVVIGLLILGNLLPSAGGKKLVHSLAILFGMAVIFSRYTNKQKGTQNG